MKACFASRSVVCFGEGELQYSGASQWNRDITGYCSPACKGSSYASAVWELLFLVPMPQGSIVAQRDKLQKPLMSSFRHQLNDIHQDSIMETAGGLSSPPLANWYWLCKIWTLLVFKPFGTETVSVVLVPRTKHQSWKTACSFSELLAL